MNAGDLQVRLVADLRNFTSNLVKATTVVRGFATTTTASLSAVSRVAASLGNSIRRMIPYGTLGLTGVTALIVKTGAAAEEADNLFEVSFGGMSKSVRAWSEDLARQLKVSSTGLRQTAANFQIFMTGMDIAPEKAREMSTALTELTFDMASLRNLRFDEALAKVQAGLSGEVEPLRRLGVTVNETTVKLWAQKQGLNTNVQAWSEQQKVIARAGVIFQALQKDMGDLNRTQGSTTNLLKSIGDQFKEVAIAIYDKWRPYVQQTLTGIRDWLIDNRDAIAEWAGKVVAYLLYAKDAFLGFVKILRTSPKEGFSVLMESLVAVMKAAAQIAIDLAIRIGKGIWQGVKEGIFGEDQQAIRARALQLYEAGGGEYTRQETRRGPLITATKVDQLVPAFPKQWEAAVQQAQNERVNQINQSIMAGFGDNFKATVEQAGKDIRESSEQFGDVMADADANLKRRLDGVTASAGEAGDAMKEAGEHGADGMNEAGAALNTLQSKIPNLKQAWIDAGTEGAKQAGKWTQMWTRAASGIAGSMEDAFASIVKDVKSASDAVEKIVEGIADAVSRAMFQTYMLKPIFQGIGTFMPGFPTTAPGMAPAVQQGAYANAGNVGGYHGFAKGGLVYAASGAFIPRGTDTVPAMLTPGEGVLDQDTTSRLRRLLAVPEPAPTMSRPIQINVQAIDAAGTYQFLEKNKRAIAAMVNDAQGGNHPARRNTR